MNDMKNESEKDESIKIINEINKNNQHNKIK